MKPGQIVVAISGVKNSGKTTFIEKLIPVLLAHGAKVAVIKHDGHGFVPDVPGTDTYRLLKAGACGAVIFDEEKLMLTRYAPVSETELIGCFPEADIILLEGFKQSAFKKIELVRKGVSSVPVCDAKTLIALATDTGISIEGIPCIGLDDIESAALMILKLRVSGFDPLQEEGEDNSGG